MTMRIILCILIIVFTLDKFLAKAAGDDTLRFAFLTDLHVSPGNDNEPNLHKVVDELNKSRFDFVVVTGDLTNTGSNEELYAVENALKKLLHTLYIIPGNHETNWSESAGLKFNEIWNNDRFAFNYKHFNFIGLSTGPFMKMGDGHVKNEDILWLKNKIKEFAQTHDDLIAFTHYPLNNELDNWDEITQILNQGQCKLVFCGHGHKLQVMNFNGIAGVMGRALFMKKNDSPGYQIVEIRNDSVFITNKILEAIQIKPTYQFNYLKPDTLKSLSTSSLPDYSINQKYPGIKPDFSYQDSSSIFGGPAIFKDKILIFGNSEGQVKAIDIKSKIILWKIKFDGPLYSTPIIYNETAVIGTSNGHLTAIDINSGKIKWQLDFKSPILSEGIEEKGFIYQGCGDSAFVKINIAKGQVEWKYTDIKGSIQGKPAIYKNYIVFGAWDTYFYCLDKNSGVLLWKWNNGKTQKLFSPGNILPAIANEKIFIVAPDRYMTALDIKSGKEIWRTNRYRVRESMGMSADGKIIYAKLMNDSVIAVSSKPEKFEVLWALNIGFGYEHSPCPIVSVKNNVILTTKNGLVAVIDEEEKKIKWIRKETNCEANKILIDNQRVWVTFTNGLITSYNLSYN